METYRILLFSIIIGTLSVILFPLAQKLSFTKFISNSSKPVFLILGVSNSGKTAFFNHIVRLGGFSDEEDDKDALTVMSQEENSELIKLPLGLGSNSKYELVDYPGHKKFENLLLNKLNELNNNLKGIVFMIDSTSSNEQFETIAKYLFNVLKVTERKTNGVDFCLACNKSDLFNSKSPARIRSILESEINKLIKINAKNVATSSNLDQDDLNEDENYWSLKEFNFESLDGNMDFSEGSVLKQKTETWENWFDEKSVN